MITPTYSNSRPCVVWMQPASFIDSGLIANASPPSRFQLISKSPILISWVLVSERPAFGQFQQ